MAEDHWNFHSKYFTNKENSSKNYTKPSTSKEKQKNMASMFSKIKLDNFFTMISKLIFHGLLQAGTRMLNLRSTSQPS